MKVVLPQPVTPMTAMITSSGLEHRLKMEAFKASSGNYLSSSGTETGSRRLSVRGRVEKAKSDIAEVMSADMMVNVVLYQH